MTVKVLGGSRAIRALLAALLAVVSGGSPVVALAPPQAGAPAGQGHTPAPDLSLPHVDGEVLVKYKADAAPGQRSSARQAVGATPGEAISRLARDTEVLRLPPGVALDRAIQALQRHPSVEVAEPNYVLSHGAVPNDPRYLDGSLWGMYGDASVPANPFGSQAAEAWALGHTGSDTIYVGVIDTGIQFTHPELAPNIWTNPFDPVDGIDNDGNGFVDDIHGWDFDNNDNTVFDSPVTDAHGTHVSGTIGAQGGDGLGVVGVNWNVTIIPGKFLDPSGTTANAIRALDYMTDLKVRHGLNIVATNNSWGGGGFSSLLRDAINRGGDAGILFIAAAGNGGADSIGDNNDVVPNCPSNYTCVTRFDTGLPRGWDCVVAVASITPTGAKSSFSNYGAVSVDLGAPGSSILSTVPTSTYDYYGGTSMATPHVTGAVALCASINPALTADVLRSILLSNTAPTPSLAGLTVTGGRLDISAMVSHCLPAGLGGRNAAISTGSVELAWTPGAAQAGYRIYRVNTGTGTVDILPAGPALPAAQADFVDTSAASGVMYCYFVVPVNGSGVPLGVSDALCAQPGTQSGTVVPGHFTLTLGQSDVAAMSWTAPAGGADSYNLAVLPLDGSPPSFITLGGGATSYAFDTAGVYHCFILIGKRSGSSDGNSDPLCGLPGVSTLSSARGGALDLSALVQGLRWDSMRVLADR